MSGKEYPNKILKRDNQIQRRHRKPKKALEENRQRIDNARQKKIDKKQESHDVGYDAQIDL